MPAPITDDEILGWLKKPSGKPVEQSSPDRDMAEPMPTTNDEEYIRANQQGSVPLDIKSGLPSGDRLKNAFRREQEDQVRALQKKYGDDTVRLDKHGSMIVRMPDPDNQGKFKDILVDERKLSWKDGLDVAGFIPELVGGFMVNRAAAASKLGKLKGIPGAAREIISGSLGAAAGGAATDVATRTLDGAPIDPAEIANARAKQALTEAAFGTMGAGVLRVGRKVFDFARSPWGRSRGVVQTEAIDAVNYIKEKTGIEISLTAGELTGNTNFQMLEAVAGKVPFAKNTIKAALSKKEGEVREVQQFMLGTKPLPTDEEAGLLATQYFRGLKEGAEASAEGAKQAVLRTGTDNLNDLLDQSSIPDRQMLGLTTIGKSIRAKAVEKREQFRAFNKENYGKVEELAGDQPFISTGGIRSKAKEILENRPAKTVLEDPEVGGLLDSFGREMGGEPVTKRVPLKSSMPEETKKFLSDFASLDDKMKLSELVEMRRVVNNAMDRTAPLPGIDDKLLGEMSHSITGAIDNAVNDLPTGELKAALGKANGYYKKNFGKFMKPGVRDLYIPDTEMGHVGDHRLVKRIVGGTGDVDLFNRYKEFLGEGTKEFGLLKRAMVNDILADAHNGGEFIDAATFINRIKLLSKDSHEISQEIFGPRVRSLIDNARAMGAVQGKITEADVTELLQGKTAVSLKLMSALAKQKDLDKLYRNDVIKKFVKGEVGDEVINPEEFVSRFVDVASTGEIRDAMAILAKNPALSETIQRKTLESFFRKAARSPTPEDIARGFEKDSTRMVSSRAMAEVLGKGATKEKLGAVLGDDSMKLLDALLKATNVTEAKDRSAAQVGGFIGGGILNNMLSSTKAVYSVAKYKAIATMLTSTKMKAILSQPWKESDWTPALRAIVVSEPFVRTMVEDFKQDPATHKVLDQFREAVGLKPDEDYQREGRQPPVNDGEILRFLRGQ